MTIHDPRLTPARPDLAAEHLRGRVEAAAFAAPRAMRVVAALAPLRREPRPDAPLDTEALAGEAVAVYERHEGWAWGQLERDGYVGYLPEQALAEAAPAPTHVVTALSSFVYPGASIKLPPLACLTLGAQVAVVGEAKEFLVLADGGHVFAAHLAGLGAAEADFVAVAERFRGAPYLWGGKSVRGIDCSGLVQTSLAAAGITAPRDTHMQEAALGHGLDPARPELFARGDLVFWKGHVGILSDARTLLHANAHTMSVFSEHLAEACARIQAKSHGAVTSVRRLTPAPAP